MNSMNSVDGHVKLFMCGRRNARPRVHGGSEVHGEFLGRGRREQGVELVEMRGEVEADVHIPLELQMVAIKEVRGGGNGCAFLLVYVKAHRERGRIGGVHWGDDQWREKKEGRRN